MPHLSQSIDILLQLSASILPLFSDPLTRVKLRDQYGLPSIYFRINFLIIREKVPWNQGLTSIIHKGIYALRFNSFGIPDAKAFWRIFRMD
jgi:hypothetical protein